MTSNLNANANAMQWAPSGHPLDAVPGLMVRFLASPDGTTYGYGYGRGPEFIFGTVHGDITVLPTQWVQRHDDGRVTVHDTEPDT